MAEILDVINRFTYEVEDKELQQASQQIQNQINGLGVLAQRQLQLQQAFDRTSANEIQKRTRIASLIQQTKQRIDETTQSIGKQVRENQKLQTAITREIGLINTLDARLKVLREDRAKAFDVKDIQRYNREIEATQKKLSNLTSTSGGGVLGRIGGSILQGVGIGTGIGLVSQGVSAIKSLISESITLAEEAEGVERAFNRIDKPNLLAGLRTSVKGTVSDLELMKKAVEFDNFGLPVEKLGIALDFARKRANDTGQSVDYLVNSIVTGIGRQSPLILDNLGINAKRVADRFKETGNFAEAAFSIIQEESAKSVTSIDSVADAQARLNADLQNLQRQAGDTFSAIELIAKSFISDIFSEGFGTQTSAAFKLLEDKAKLKAKADAENFRKGFVDQIFPTLRAAQKYLDDNPLTIKPSFNLFKAEFLGKLNKSQLEELKKEGDDALGLLSSSDKQGIKNTKDRIALIENALKSFANTTKNVKREVTKNKIKTRDLIAQTPEQWEAEIDKITESLAKIRQPFSGMTTTDSGIVEQPENLTGQTSDEIITQRNEIRRKEKSDQIAADKAKAARELRVQQEKDAFNTIADAAIQSYNIILQAQINSADAEIAIRQSRVNAAIELAKDGNDEILKIEQKRLEESIKEREKFAQRQAAINSALTISQSVLAIATAASQSGAGALVIVPAVIAAIAAGFAAVTALSQETAVGFKDGGVDIQGAGTGKSDSIPAKISKGESVITAEATAKNKEVLKAINNGAVFSMPNTKTINYNSNSTMLDMGGVIKELKSVKKAVANNAFKQDIYFNEHGVGTLTQKAIANDRRKWS